MKAYIYALYNPLEPDKILYIGQTKNLDGRMKTHLSGRDKITAPIHDSCLKLGVPLAFRILEETDDLNGFGRESFWIDKIKPPFNKRADVPPFEFRVSPIVSLAEMEIRYILYACDFCGGNLLQAHKILGIGRQTLYNKLRAAGIDPDSMRQAVYHKTSQD